MGLSTTVHKELVFVSLDTCRKNVNVHPISRAFGTVRESVNSSHRGPENTAFARKDLARVREQHLIRSQVLSLSGSIGYAAQMKLIGYVEIVQLGCKVHLRVLAPWVQNVVHGEAGQPDEDHDVKSVQDLGMALQTD